MADNPQQLTLDLAAAPAMTRDAFIADASNEAALRLVETWPAWDGPVALVIGGPASGKSHLADIWRERADARGLMPETLADVAARPLPAGTALLLEDADRVSLDETALFHLLNAVRHGGGSLMMTARTPPGTWSLALPDLRSRLDASLRADILPPGDAFLARLLAKLFADRQVTVDPELPAWLLARMDRTPEAAVRMVDRLDSSALARGRRITRVLAAEILAGDTRDDPDLFGGDDD